MDTSRKLTQLFPESRTDVQLDNLYLTRHPEVTDTFIYTNFITSLDGRIAIDHPITGKHGIPNFITNDRDWRLYQELAARADVLLVSARYMRELIKGEAQDNLPVSQAPEFEDLRQWRLSKGLSAQPAVVILSSSMDLPLKSICEIMDREVFVATGKQSSVRSIEDTPAQIIYAGENKRVEAKWLITQLANKGFKQIYSIAGSGVFETLVKDRMLDRLYLTQVHRIIGGKAYDSLIEGDLLVPPSNFKLTSLHYDESNSEESNGSECGQFFCIFDKAY